jgi:hypothetical protein
MTMIEEALFMVPPVVVGVLMPIALGMFAPNRGCPDLANCGFCRLGGGHGHPPGDVAGSLSWISRPSPSRAHDTGMYRALATQARPDLGAPTLGAVVSRYPTSNKQISSLRCDPA